MLLCLRAADDIPLGERCPFLGCARNSGRGGTVTIIIAPLGLLYPERSRCVHPERSRGVGIYTGVLVSASLDEQFMSGAESTQSEAEGCYYDTAPLGLLHPERSRGVGLYTGVLVSASLDEQFMSPAEEHFTSQGFFLLFEDISPLQDNSDSILPRVAKTYLHDEILWYARVHG
jgi:hypothetical protein